MRHSRLGSASSAVLVLTAVLSLPVAAQPPAGEQAGLEQLLAASADSPAEHRALAAYFRSRAARARDKAASHRWMADHYGGSLKPEIAAGQKRHCAQLSRSYEGQAKQFDRLAEEHEEAAAEE